MGIWYNGGKMDNPAPKSTVAPLGAIHSGSEPTALPLNPKVILQSEAASTTENSAKLPKKLTAEKHAEEKLAILLSNTSEAATPGLQQSFQAALQSKNLANFTTASGLPFHEELEKFDLSHQSAVSLTDMAFASNVSPQFMNIKNTGLILTFLQQIMSKLHLAAGEKSETPHTFKGRGTREASYDALREGSSTLKPTISPASFAEASRAQFQNPGISPISNPSKTSENFQHLATPNIAIPLLTPATLQKDQARRDKVSKADIVMFGGAALTCLGALFLLMTDQRSTGLVILAASTLLALPLFRKLFKR